MNSMILPQFTIAYWCVLMAALLPVACAGVGKWGTFSQPRKTGGFDNHNPRQWWAAQSDWRQRANSAQANTFEALPFFFAAVCIAHQLKAAQPLLDVLCLGWVFLRCLFALAYVADMATARTTVWALALGANIGILFAGFR